MNRQLYQPLHKKGKAIVNADPSGMKACVTLPGKHLNSAAAQGEGEGNQKGWERRGRCSLSIVAFREVAAGRTVACSIKPACMNCLKKLQPLSLLEME